MQQPLLVTGYAALLLIVLTHTIYVCRGEVPESVRDYIGGLGGYKKNDFSTLEPKLKQRIADEWADSFTEFGYEF